MDQLNPQDAQFLYLESDDNLTHLTSISIFDQSTVPGDGIVHFKDILEHVESRLHMSPLFRRRLVHVPLELDFPYWVDDESFDLEYHVHHSRLPEPSDWRQFCIHMARYHSRPLDMKRPLWDMYVVEGLDNIDWLPKGSYALATKIHHAAVDGKAIMDFFGAMADIDNKGTPAVPLHMAPLHR
ncbi:MAG: wax ester/triacylglycerol synthase domain-containing protein, partial [Woeseiaceae bacterium]